MTAGVPGAGIGGLFYLLNALLMPVRELWRIPRGASSPKSRQIVVRQFAIAVGIIGAIWVVAWLISMAVRTRPRLAVLAGIGGQTDAAENLPRVLTYSTLTVGGVTLGIVLLSVVVLRWAVAARILAVTFAIALPFDVSAQSVQEFLQQADAAFKNEDAATAERAYRAVLELDQEQSRAVYRLAQLLERNDPQESEQLYRRYVELEPDDAWGYIALAESLGRSGRYSEALELYDEAVRLAPNEDDSLDGRARMRERARPMLSSSIEPGVTFSRDSDGNTRFRSVVGGDLSVRDRARFGLSVGHTRVADAVGTRSFNDFLVYGRFRSGPALQIDAAGGAVRVDGGALPIARARMVTATPGRAARLDLRVTRNVLDATPLLITNRQVRTEVQMRPDVAVSSAFRIRGVGGAGWIQGAEETNRRYTTGGGAAWIVAPAIEISGSFNQTQYERPSSAGYFAPQRIQSIDIGSYMEFERERSLVALDFGVGGERFREHGAAFGSWRPAFRGYALFSFQLQPGRELRFEVDGYNTQAGAVTAPASGWSYGSVSATFRWAL